MGHIKPSTCGEQALGSSWSGGLSMGAGVPEKLHPRAKGFSKQARLPSSPETCCEQPGEPGPMTWGGTASGSWEGAGAQKHLREGWACMWGHALVP